MTCPQIERARNSHPRLAIHKQSCRDSGHEDVPLTSRLPEPERPVNEPPDAWSLDDGLLGHCDSLCRCRGTLICWLAFRGWELRARSTRGHVTPG